MGWSLLQSHHVSISLLCLDMALTHPAASKAFPVRAADVRGTRLVVPMAADTRGGGAGCRVCHLRVTTSVTSPVEARAMLQFPCLNRYFLEAIVLLNL